MMASIHVSIVRSPVRSPFIVRRNRDLYLEQLLAVFHFAAFSRVTACPTSLSHSLSKIRPLETVESTNTRSYI